MSHSNEGYIKLHRKIRQSRTFKSLKDSKQRDIFIQCLIEANYIDSEEEGMKIERGGFLTSVREFTQLCADDVNERNVRTCWKKLVKEKAIKLQIVKINGQNRTYIKVNNYDKYQDKKVTQQTTHHVTQLLTHLREDQKQQLIEESEDSILKVTQQVTQQVKHQTTQQSPDSIVMQQDPVSKEVKEIKEFKEVLYYYSSKFCLKELATKRINRNHPDIVQTEVVKFVDKSVNKAWGTGKYSRAHEPAKMISSWFDVAVYEGKFEKYKVKRNVVKPNKRLASTEELMKEIVKQITPNS